MDTIWILEKKEGISRIANQLKSIGGPTGVEPVLPT